MAVISEDFVRCDCGNAEFEKKEIVTIHKRAKRQDKYTSYPTMEEEVRYYCTQCRKEKD